jgi:hypothetical protein
LRPCSKWRGGRFVLRFPDSGKRGTAADSAGRNEDIAMKTLSVWLLATLAACALVGCVNQKAPAEQAVASAESALAAIRDEAQKYAPEQLQVVDGQLNSMKDNLSKGNYPAVLAASKDVNTAISGLKDSADSKKAEADAVLAKAKDAWGPLSSDVPKMVDAIQTRVDKLSKERRLPKGVSKDSVASAKSALDSMKSGWSDASNAAASGDYTTAVSKAQTVKDQATDTMKSLGIIPS